MPTLEDLLAGIQGVKDLPEEATRKSVVDHTHSDVYRGAVKQENSIVRRLNGLVKAVREGKITRETARKAAQLAIAEKQKALTEIATSHAKRSLNEIRRKAKLPPIDTVILPQEMSERLNRISEESLKAFETVLADVK